MRSFLLLVFNKWHFRQPASLLVPDSTVICILYLPLYNISVYRCVRTGAQRALLVSLPFSAPDHALCAALIVSTICRWPCTLLEWLDCCLRKAKSLNLGLLLCFKNVQNSNSWADTQRSVAVENPAQGEKPIQVDILLCQAGGDTRETVDLRHQAA